MLLLQEGANLATPLWPAARIFDRNRHRLHGRLKQTQGNAEVMEPSLQFVFHISPLGSRWRR